MTGGFQFRTARRALPALLVAVLALGACGGSGKDKTVSLATVSESTAEAKSARIFSEFVFDGGSTVSMEGEFEFGTGYSHMTMRSSEKGIPSATYIYGGKNSYFGPIDEPASGPRWVRMEDEEGSSASGNLDPKEFLSDLEESGAKLTKTGTGSVHGEDTTVYKFKIAGADDSDTSNEFTAYGDANGTIEIGDDGRLRRFVLIPEHPTPASEIDDADDKETAPKKLTFEVWDYGVEVDLSVDESRVVEVTDPAAKDLVTQVFGADVTGE